MEGHRKEGQVGWRLCIPQGLCWAHDFCLVQGRSTGHVQAA